MRTYSAGKMISLRCGTVVAIFLTMQLSAVQLNGQTTADALALRTSRPVLVDVSFQGNLSLAEADLRSRISSAPSTLSSLGRLARLARSGALDRLAYFFRLRAGDGVKFRYLNTATVNEDKVSIVQLYKEFGFHEARVRALYTYDTLRSIARVVFDIEEGIRYRVSGIELKGAVVDSLKIVSNVRRLPPAILREVQNYRYLREGEGFSVTNVDLEVDRIIGYLKTVGYPFAREYRIPHVVVCSPPECPDRTDSVILYIDPDTRYRVRSITITPSPEDTAASLEPVSEGVIRSQMEFELGEWYDRRDIDASRQNLYGIGIFDEVRLDAVDVDSARNEMGVRVRYSLRDENELEGSLELSVLPRSDETVFTTGLAGRYTRLNLFDQGWIWTIGARLSGRLPSFEEIEYRAESALDIPVSSFLGARAFTFSGVASLGTVDRASDFELRAERVSGAVEMNWRFPGLDWLSSASLRFGYQFNSFTGVSDFIGERARLELDAASLPAGCDTLSLQSDIVDVLARNVYRLQVLQGDAAGLMPSDEARTSAGALKQTLILGATFVSDKRNDFFSPTKGTYLQGNVDLGLTGGFANPIGSFIRLEGDFRAFLKSSGSNAWAFRAHGGIVFQPPGFPLTPLGSRFHAGGANSVRGWGAREMLVTSPAAVISDTCASPIISEIISDSRRLLGGLLLIEGSVEYRWSVTPDVVIVPFVDVGNAYFRNYSDDLDLITLETITKNLGLAMGVNFGYVTPAGPIRVGAGFPVYNPIDDNTFAIQLSIGHAF